MDYQISNDYLEAGFKRKGAELCSLLTKDGNTELIWEADPNVWGRHAPILFPIVGRLKDDIYHYRGNDYHLKQHGFARNHDFQVAHQDDRQIAFELFSTPEIAYAYPYFFRLEIIYTLKGKELLIRYKVENRDDKEIHFSIGAHPAFRCPIYPNENRSDYRLVFSQGEYANSELLENGLRTGASRLILENTRELPISDDLFDLDALIFRNLKSDKVSLCNRDREILTLSFTGFPYLGIWSKSQTSQFICIEPWYGIADFVNSEQDFSEKEGILSLQREASFACEYSIQVH